MKESQYVSQIVACVDAFLPDSAVLKVHGSSNQPKGTPDLFISHRGQLVVIETKVENNEPSDIQKYRLQYWAKSGAIAFWSSESFAQPIQVVDFIKWYVEFRFKMLHVLELNDTQYTWQNWQNRFKLWLMER